MSRPHKMICSKCGKNITMAGSEICNVCTPINASSDDFEEQLEAAEKAPLLCAECFRIVHQHSVKVGM